MFKVKIDLKTNENVFEVQIIYDRNSFNGSFYGFQTSKIKLITLLTKFGYVVKFRNIYIRDHYIEGSIYDLRYLA